MARPWHYLGHRGTVKPLFKRCVCVALLSRTSCVRVRHQGVLDPIPDVRSTAAKAMGQLVQGMGAEALGDQVIGRNRGREDLRTEQRSRPSAFLLCFVAATSS